jgi:ABC-type branched-subunit amino acid transport system substrate-binding protein
MDPIRIGWLGSALDGPGGGYDKIHQMAFDQATELGLLDRPVELVIHPENGLPQGSAKNATDGFRWLVDEGCIGVAGAYSSDNAITVGPLANELHVPLVSWCGTEQFHGDYCFRLGNGDCGGDATLIVAWAQAERSRASCRTQRDLAQRGGVLPVLPPRVPATRNRRGRG